MAKWSPGISQCVGESVEVIHPDILARLPEGAPREKLLLLDGLAADALDAADSAQGRLNNLGRMHPGSGDANPNVVRLAAIVAMQSDRHQALSSCSASPTPSSGGCAAFRPPPNWRSPPHLARRPR